MMIGNSNDLDAEKMRRLDKAIAKDMSKRVNTYYVHDLSKSQGSYLIQIPEGYEICGEFVNLGALLIAIPVEKK